MHEILHDQNITGEVLIDAFGRFERRSQGTRLNPNTEAYLDRVGEHYHDLALSFLESERRNFPSGEINYIIVPGTNPAIDAERFNARTLSGKIAAEIYPNAKVIYTGKCPHESRMSEEESAKLLPEAQMMAGQAIELGLDPERIIVEPDSTNIDQNMINALKIIAEQSANSDGIGIVVTSSLSSLMRAQLSLRRAIVNTFPDLKSKIRSFSLSSDNDLRSVFPWGPTAEYEISRLLKYGLIRFNLTTQKFEKLF